MEKYKTVKEKRDLYIEFSEEELQELGWKENQKLSLDVDGKNIFIKPWVNVEIDTANWPKEIYQMLVNMSLEQDKTVNEIIVDLITKCFESTKTKEQLLCE